MASLGMDDKPRALGLKFKADRGQQILITITKNTRIPFVLYTDIFRLNETGASLIYASDTTKTQFSVDIQEPGNYVLRLQPELFRYGAYSLSLLVGPSLGFPVSGNKAKTGSFWGASRDGGKRRHEGIDIFAPKLTPVIASDDGIVTGVLEGGLGGKVVWLKLPQKDITLYYAHLDKQLVIQGQEVRRGDTLGLVGNTGNAQHTASHLHFGIYTSNGPIDPFPFINPQIKPAPVVADKNLTNYIILKKPIKNSHVTEPVKANTLLIPLAVNSKGYIAELPGGDRIEVPFSWAQTTAQPVKRIDAIVKPVDDNVVEKKGKLK